MGISMMKKTLFYGTLLLAIQANVFAGENWLIDTDHDWQTNQSQQKTLELKDGMASPLEKNLFIKVRSKNLIASKKFKASQWISRPFGRTGSPLKI